MAKTIKTDKGPITLYNPSERAKKFCDDLKTSFIRPIFRLQQPPRLRLAPFEDRFHHFGVEQNRLDTHSCTLLSKYSHTARLT